MDKHLSLFFDEPDVLRKANVKNVRCLFKDSRQLIWIGTDNGLIRYDGTNIIYQRHQPLDTTSIPNNTIASITEDKEGNIWIGTMGGVACMNPFSLKCKVYREELGNLPAGNFDNKLLIGPSGEVWIGNSSGLYLLDKKKNAFKNVWRNRLPGKKTSGYITSLLYWTRDTLVAGTFNDIVLINTRDFGFRRLTPMNKDVLVGHLLIDAAHHLWIGTWSQGCFISNPALTSFQHYMWEKVLPSGVENIVQDFNESFTSDEHNVWISSTSSILKFPITKNSPDVDLQNVTVFRKNFAKDVIQKEEFGPLISDENYIWIGGTSILRFPASKSLFQALPIPFNGTVQNIQQLIVDGRQYIAVSLWHGSAGLVLFDQQNAITHVIKSILPGDAFGTNIAGVARDALGRIWVASLAGVFILNNKFEVEKNLTASLKGVDAIDAKKTNDILINNDTVWIACYKNGIDLYNLQFHKLKHFALNDGSGLKDDLMQKIFKDSRGNIWICANAFFYKYQPQTATFKSYDLNEEHISYSPADIAELPDGNLVLACKTGLIVFNPGTETYYKVSTPLLKTEEDISSVCVDAKGDIWYLTSNHLVDYQPRTKSFTLFGEEDGLDVSGLQWIKTFDGMNIYLGDNEKLLAFSPQNWQHTASALPLIIHAVQVNDSSIQFSRPVSKLDLNYDQNKIYIEFDGVTYIKPEQNLYKYKLDGLDKDWVQSNKNFVSYTNLPPGKYTFQVLASDYTGAWSKEYQIPITIKPPFWETWWFITLAIIAAGISFFLVVRYISQRNLREKILRLEKEQAVEKERNRIARDMHDDLGSGLTKIAILSEVAKTQLQQKEAATTQLESISYSSRELVDNLQNIIWVLNPKNDSLDNLAAYIREYTLKFFEATDVHIQFNYPQQIPSVKLSEEQRRNIFMVVKETLNNTAKHSSCAAIDIKLCIQKHQLKIDIADNGKGFETASIRKFANGLSNMKQRMEQIGGSYEIFSGAGRGTVTKLTVLI